MAEVRPSIVMLRGGRATAMYWSYRFGVVFLIAVFGTGGVAKSRPGSLAMIQTTTTVPVTGEVGLELLFELRPATGQELDPATVIELRTILRQQLSLLGVEGQVIRRHDGKILVRVDATSDPEGVTHALTAAPQLEIVDTKGQSLAPGTNVHTSLSTAATTATPISGPEAGAIDLIFTTVVSGTDVREVSLLDDPATGQQVIGFTLDSEAAKRFSDFTSTHIGEPMAIVLVKRVLSSPTIVAPIAGDGIIAGVPEEDVRLLATQLQIGTLGVPLVLVAQRIVPAVTALPTPDAA